MMMGSYKLPAFFFALPFFFAYSRSLIWSFVFWFDAKRGGHRRTDGREQEKLVCNVSAIAVNELNGAEWGMSEAVDSRRSRDVRFMNDCVEDGV